MKFVIRYILSFCTLILLQSSLYAAKPKGEVLGRVESGDLREVSGIAASRMNSGVVWLHNDGRSNQLYAVRANGETAAILEWPNPMVDFEDVASGPGPTTEQDYLYIGDIGDNESRRPQVRVYRAVEPTVKSTGRGDYVSAEITDFRFTYPDGPADAEALLVDGESGDIYIVTKEKKQARIFRAAADKLKPRQAVPLEEIATLGIGNISAGDISRDGRWIMVRNEKEGWLWPRAEGQSVSEALSASVPKKLTVRAKSQSKNGEGICFSPDSTGYFTVSEGAHEPVVLFPLPSVE
jgi:hypothetical protein